MKKDITEEQVLMLENLVKSPVFNALKDLLSGYRETCMNELLQEKDPYKLFQLQGRIIGLNVIENLPQVRVQLLDRKRAEELKKSEEAEKKAEFEHRLREGGSPKVK